MFIESVKYLIVALFILSSCSRKCDEERFSSKLQDIAQNEEWLIGKNDKAIEYKGIDLIAEFKASEFTVRIEILPDGSYKYSSWGKNRSTEQSPDIILYNGKMECWDETGACECNAVYDNGKSTILGRRYTFESNGYLYQFEYGWWKGDFRKYFTIFNGEEEILATKAEVVWINGMQLR